MRPSVNPWTSSSRNGCEDARAIIMNSVAPIWNGNATWLVFGGLGLLAAFPLALAIIIPAVYFPILIMLLALVFRGVAFEFRFKHTDLRRFWDRASFIQGFKVDGRHFTGTSFGWVTPFALLTGIALMFGYSLLGAG
jgi:cytochrome d ubiquinol oxidase subunit II